ncbi:MAG TPA: hypothetical protein VGO93_11340 [Candidatus Xenobia bacterium]|jgi:hypothetical protein
MEVRVASILPDARRTYLELKWTPPIKIGMFVETATLADPLGNPLARRPEWDAGTNLGEYFLGFEALPLSASHAILTLRFKTDPGQVVVPVRLDPRQRGAGQFDLPSNSTLTVLGRRFEAISYRGGITEAAVRYRFQCGEASWPVEVQGSLTRPVVAVRSEAVPIEGRVDAEMVLEGPQDPRQQSLRLQAIAGFPLREAIVVTPDDTRLTVRREGVLLPLSVLWGDGEVRVRLPHVQATGAVEVRGLGHPMVGDADAIEGHVTTWPAGTELMVPLASGPAPVTLRSLTLAFNPSPALRLARG